MGQIRRIHLVHDCIGKRREPCQIATTTTTTTSVHTTLTAFLLKPPVLSTVIGAADKPRHNKNLHDLRSTGRCEERHAPAS